MLWPTLPGIAIFLTHALLFGFVARQIQGTEQAFLTEKLAYTGLACAAYTAYVFAARRLAMPMANPIAEGRRLESAIAAVGAGLGLYLLLQAFLRFTGLFSGSERPIAKGLTILVSGLLTPMAEELLYRAGLFRFLRSTMPTAFALIVSSFCFAIVHPIVSAPFILVCGLTFGVLYWRYGLMASILAHVVYNLLILLSAG
ncbi:MAG: CPBP family intramembrane metalloprotease [Leptospirales bacterium]|nr:CPBP family intramembrane metalloprotease [Leptospirales bacterium]